MYDLSFNAFLYPNVKDTRRLFGFLFEFLFKREEDQEGSKGNQLPSNQFEVILKRRLAKWQNKPWMMPQFLKMKKPLFSNNGDKIVVEKDIDFQRIASCKSKKAKGVYELMTTFKKNDFNKAYSSAVTSLSWQTSKQGKNKVLNQGDDDDDEDDIDMKGSGRHVKKGNKNKVLKEFAQVLIQQKTVSAGGTGYSGPKEDTQEQEAKTLKDIIEEREEKLKDQEKFEDMNQTQFMDRLVEDMEVIQTPLHTSGGNQAQFN